jgi:hypothetical protein
MVLVYFYLICSEKSIMTSVHEWLNECDELLSSEFRVR